MRSAESETVHTTESRTQRHHTQQGMPVGHVCEACYRVGWNSNVYRVFVSAPHNVLSHTIPKNAVTEQDFCNRFWTAARGHIEGVLAQVATQRSHRLGGKQQKSIFLQFYWSLEVQDLGASIVVVRLSSCTFALERGRDLLCSSSLYVSI